MVVVWIILAGGVGLILGGALGYFLAERRCAAEAEQERRRAVELGAELQGSERSIAERDTRLAEARAELQALRTELAAAQVSAAALDTQLAESRRSMAEQKRLLSEAEAKLKDAFSGVSQEALQKNNEAFLALAKSRFDPMKTLLEQYQNRLAEMEQSRSRSHSDLREQLGSVAEAHRALSTQTSQLVAALSNPGTRGRWGEIGLERVLKLSGMTEGVHYDAQLTFFDENGRARPDVRVHLPGGKCIVIDSKYPGTHFFKALECENPSERDGFLRQYAQAVRNHANSLRSKEYWRKVEGSPEYVVMFLTGEAMVYAAVQADTSLLEDMFRDRVIIATPTTLIALLKAVAYGWQQAEAEKNIRDVQDIASQIVERVAIFAKHFDNVGRSLDSATQAYNAAVGSLEARLLVSARKMKELGVAGPEVPEIQPIDTAARRLTERARLPGMEEDVEAGSDAFA